MCQLSFTTASEGTEKHQRQRCECSLNVEQIQMIISRIGRKSFLLWFVYRKHQSCEEPSDALCGSFSFFSSQKRLNQERYLIVTQASLTAESVQCWFDHLFTEDEASEMCFVRRLSVSDSFVLCFDGFQCGIQLLIHSLIFLHYVDLFS